MDSMTPEQRILDMMPNLPWDAVKCSHRNCKRMAELRCPICPNAYFCETHKIIHAKAKHFGQDIEDIGIHVCEACTDFKVEFYCPSCKKYQCYKCSQQHLHPIFPLSSARGICNTNLSWGEDFFAQVSNLMEEYTEVSGKPQEIKVEFPPPKVARKAEKPKDPRLAKIQQKMPLQSDQPKQAEKIQHHTPVSPHAAGSIAAPTASSNAPPRTRLMSTPPARSIAAPTAPPVATPAATPVATPTATPMVAVRGICNTNLSWAEDFYSQVSSLREEYIEVSEKPQEIKVGNPPPKVAPVLPHAAGSIAAPTASSNAPPRTRLMSTPPARSIAAPTAPPVATPAATPMVAVSAVSAPPESSIEGVPPQAVPTPLIPSPFVIPHVGDNPFKGVILDQYNRMNESIIALDKEIRRLTEVVTSKINSQCMEEAIEINKERNTLQQKLEKIMLERDEIVAQLICYDPKLLGKYKKSQDPNSDTYKPPVASNSIVSRYIPLKHGGCASIERNIMDYLNQLKILQKNIDKAFSSDNFQEIIQLEIELKDIEEKIIELDEKRGDLFIDISYLSQHVRELIQNQLNLHK